MLTKFFSNSTYPKENEKESVGHIKVSPQKQKTPKNHRNRRYKIQEQRSTHTKTPYASHMEQAYYNLGCNFTKFGSPYFLLINRRSERVN
jgi:hypothetical protein